MVSRMMVLFRVDNAIFRAGSSLCRKRLLELKLQWYFELRGAVSSSGVRVATF